MRCVRGIGCTTSDLLEQIGVPVGLGREGVMRVCERIGVMGVRDESLDERFGVSGIHFRRETVHGRPGRVQVNGARTFVSEPPDRP